jgi:hypothetical protein
MSNHDLFFSSWPKLRLEDRADLISRRCLLSGPVLCYALVSSAPSTADRTDVSVCKTNLVRTDQKDIVRPTVLKSNAKMTLAPAIRAAGGYSAATARLRASPYIEPQMACLKVAVLSGI